MCRRRRCNLSAMLIPTGRPVVRLGIDEAKPAMSHFEVGRGNLVHILHAYQRGRHVPDPYDWAIRFEERAKELTLGGDRALIDCENADGAARLGWESGLRGGKIRVSWGVNFVACKLLN